MSFFSKVKTTVTSYNARLKAIADKQVKATEERAKKRMAQATTRTEKLKAKAQAARDKEHIYRELAQAQQSARKAASALNRARIEAGDLTASEKLVAFGQKARKGMTDFQRGLEKTQRSLQKVQGGTTRKRKTTRRKTRRY